jgi:diguanylate cyclase (GGDEF)-like protein/PAS domain S-box-containing protein
MSPDLDARGAPLLPHQPRHASGVHVLRASPWAGFFRLFAPLYALAAVLLGAAAYSIAAGDAHQDAIVLRAQEAARVEVASRWLRDYVAMLSTDLLVLARAPAAKLYAADPGPVERRRLTELFLAYASQKQVFDQVRYLDGEGMEVVRVNFADGAPVVVPEAELQPKGERYFFTDTNRLPEGAVYISPLDLNIEHGEIEVPHKPMLRLGTPVFDEAGRRRGVIILNFLGKKLLDEFRAIIAGSGQPILLNRDGYWLSAPDRADEFGFMFSRTETFATRWPEAWRRFLADHEGSVQTADGLFTFRTVRPLLARQHTSKGSARPVGESDGALSEREYFWVVVSRLSGDDVPWVSLGRYPTIAAGFALGLLLLGALLGSLVRTVLSSRELRRAVEENERHLREMTDALGVGVVVVDRQGLLTYANPEAERLLGWSAAELLDQDAHALFHHHSADGTWLEAEQCRLRRVFHTGRAYRSDAEVFWRRDGAPMPVEVSCHPIRREDGSVGLVAAFQDISDRKRDEESVRRLAYCDALTGLPNRRMLVDLLTQALAQVAHHRRALAVMFLDLDAFKRINDALGHHVGDELLRVVATRLQESVRRGDTVARLGGDEFVILLSEIAQPNDAAIVAEKIIESLRAPVTVGADRLLVTASIGIALFPFDTTEGANALLKKADEAMYRAKAAGRNTYCFSGQGDAPRPEGSKAESVT